MYRKHCNLRRLSKFMAVVNAAIIYVILFKVYYTVLYRLYINYASCHIVPRIIVLFFLLLRLNPVVQRSRRCCKY